jgi:hypothetical protein
MKATLLHSMCHGLNVTECFVVKKSDVCSGMYNNNTYNSGNILNDNFSTEQTVNMKMLCYVLY